MTILWHCPHQECGKPAFEFVGKTPPEPGDILKQDDWVRVTDGEKPQAVMCPRCGGPLYADTLFIKEAEIEEDVPAE